MRYFNGTQAKLWNTCEVKAVTRLWLSNAGNTKQCVFKYYGM